MLADPLVSECNEEQEEEISFFKLPEEPDVLFAMVNLLDDGNRFLAALNESRKAFAVELKPVVVDDDDEGIALTFVVVVVSVELEVEVVSSKSVISGGGTDLLLL